MVTLAGMRLELKHHGRASEANFSLKALLLTPFLDSVVTNINFIVVHVHCMYKWSVLECTEQHAWLYKKNTYHFYGLWACDEVTT